MHLIGSTRLAIAPIVSVAYPIAVRCGFLGVGADNTVLMVWF